MGPCPGGAPSSGAAQPGWSDICPPRAPSRSRLRRPDWSPGEPIVARVPAPVREQRRGGRGQPRRTGVAARRGMRRWAHEGTRARGRRRPGAGGDARHRPARRRFRAVVLRGRTAGDGGVPRDPPGPRAARPDAPRARRHRRLPADPGRVRRADRHADGQERHRRRGPRAGVRRRRLRRQAVQAEGARGAGAHAAAPRRPRRPPSDSRSATCPSTSPGTRSAATAGRST